METLRRPDKGRWFASSALNRLGGLTFADRGLTLLERRSAEAPKRRSAEAPKRRSAEAPKRRSAEAPKRRARPAPVTPAASYFSLPY